MNIKWAISFSLYLIAAMAFAASCAKASIVLIFPGTIYSAEVTTFTHELFVFLGDNVSGQIILQDKYNCGGKTCWADFNGWINIQDVRILIQDSHASFTNGMDASLTPYGYFSAWFSSGEVQHFGDFHFQNAYIPEPSLLTLMLFVTSIFILYLKKKNK